MFKMMCNQRENYACYFSFHIIIPLGVGILGQEIMMML